MRVFDFGANWQAFSQQHVNEVRLATAEQSLKALLQRPNLTGSTFLDVGCGSGLFSIAAQRLGASKVIGVDINPRCIEVSKQNQTHLTPHKPIEFHQASALSPESLAGLGQFDVVYAWGSLHHTGSMWQAIDNVSCLVAPGGTLVLGIYKKHITSPVWKAIKWLYNQVPSVVQRMMAVFFAGIIYIAKFLVTRANPLTKERGMDFWYDVIDWVGGYPYEYASVQEIGRFVSKHGFVLLRAIPDSVPTGITEFVFSKSQKGDQQ